MLDAIPRNPRFTAPADRCTREAGYSLLMVVFMVATILVLSAAVTPNILTQGRRERETELAWRGEQYKRAIGMYFRKFGKYPTRVEDLTQQTNGVRFLRQAYKDPINTDDGSWRFIYVGPNGQLIGSVKSQSLLQSTLTASTLPGASLFGGGMGTQPTAPGATGAGMAGSTGTTGATPPSGQTGLQSGGGLSSNPMESQPSPLGGAVIGGNIIGVGSKVKKPSLRVYEGGDSYDKWEFIWNPLTQGLLPGQQATTITAPPPAAVGQPAAGQSPTGAAVPGQTTTSAPAAPGTTTDQSGQSAPTQTTPSQ